MSNEAGPLQPAKDDYERDCDWLEEVLAAPDHLRAPEQVDLRATVVQTVARVLDYCLKTSTYDNDNLGSILYDFLQECIQQKPNRTGFDLDCQFLGRQLYIEHAEEYRKVNAGPTPVAVPKHTASGKPAPSTNPGASVQVAVSRKPSAKPSALKRQDAPDPVNTLVPGLRVGPPIGARKETSTRTGSSVGSGTKRKHAGTSEEEGDEDEEDEDEEDEDEDVEERPRGGRSLKKPLQQPSGRARSQLGASTKAMVPPVTHRSNSGPGASTLRSNPTGGGIIVGGKGASMEVGSASGSKAGVRKAKKAKQEATTEGGEEGSTGKTAKAKETPPTEQKEGGEKKAKATKARGKAGKEAGVESKEKKARGKAGKEARVEFEKKVGAERCSTCVTLNVEVCAQPLPGTTQNGALVTACRTCKEKKLKCQPHTSIGTTENDAPMKARAKRRRSVSAGPSRQTRSQSRAREMSEAVEVLENDDEFERGLQQQIEAQQQLQTQVGGKVKQDVVSGTGSPKKARRTTVPTVVVNRRPAIAVPLGSDVDLTHSGPYESIGQLSKRVSEHEGLIREHASRMDGMDHRVTQIPTGKLVAGLSDVEAEVESLRSKHEGMLVDLAHVRESQRKWEDERRAALTIAEGDIEKLHENIAGIRTTQEMDSKTITSKIEKVNENIARLQQQHNDTAVATTENFGQYQRSLLEVVEQVEAIRGSQDDSSGDATLREPTTLESLAGRLEDLENNTLEALKTVKESGEKSRDPQTELLGEILRKLDILPTLIEKVNALQEKVNALETTLEATALQIPLSLYMTHPMVYGPATVSESNGAQLSDSTEPPVATAGNLHTFYPSTFTIHYHPLDDPAPNLRRANRWA
ncbi:hypothetical protein FA13DRAFT_1798013 [Coprinellus micaceus]|uniref:Uncharacterized protein n=1 Tax=Coprinellus micaceus TaxID=71717 RepID=A0A4Y7SNQ3_COPMI|nr:hypothetical protein FA13DRAFT_1798013 [Coprinellus micaceus]